MDTVYQVSENTYLVLPSGYCFVFGIRIVLQSFDALVKAVIRTKSPLHLYSGVQEGLKSNHHHHIFSERVVQTWAFPKFPTNGLGGSGGDAFY